MQAIRVREFGGPEQLQLEEAPDPAPAAGQILIDVEGAGVNPLDLALRSGNHPRVRLMSLPWTPGAEAAGTVVSVGPGVEGFSAGDRVYGSAASGAYAERALLSVSRTAQLPDDVSGVEGASLPITVFTAIYGLIFRVRLSVAETVRVHGGAGGVGLMGVQVAKAAGARVLTTVSSPEKAAFVQDYGPDVVINYREEDFAQRCLEETHGRGVDLVLEMVASEHFDNDCRALRLGGRLVVLGAGAGKKVAGTVTYPPFYSKDIDVLGFSLFNAEADFPDMLRRADALLTSGAVCRTLARPCRWRRPRGRTRSCSRARSGARSS